MDDRALVERQLGRPPRAFRRVAVRCPFGRPAVTEQEPYDAAGEPFPTTYYLTCRHLVAALARVEAAGGVERWSGAAQTDPELAASLARATSEQRRIRRTLARGATGGDGGASLDLGIGGSRRPERLKCLHAHAAFALARPGYELGERILAEVEPPWPATCCSEEQRLPSRPVTSAVEIARQEWRESHRRLESAADDRRGHRALLEQLELVTGELRRRVGQTFTLHDLASEYGRADEWAREVLLGDDDPERPAGARPATVALVQGAAFHLYARGALDYTP